MSMAWKRETTIGVACMCRTSIHHEWWLKHNDQKGATLLRCQLWTTFTLVSGADRSKGLSGPTTPVSALRALLRDAMALLDTFRYVNFIHAEDVATNTESKGGGLPRYGGEPQKLSEYSWRVRARMTREALLPEEEQKETGPPRTEVG